MSGSGAGSNYFNAYLLTNVTAPSAVISPLTAYGTIGVNDSGWWFTEGMNFSKVTFSLEQVGATALAGFEVTIYGTNSPAVRQTWWNAIQGPRTALVAVGTGQGAANLVTTYYGGTSYGGPSAVGLATQGMTNAAGYVPGIPPALSIPVPAPSEQSGTGGVTNPLTASTIFLVTTTPFNAYRAVVTNSSGAAGTFSLAVAGIP